MRVLALPHRSTLTRHHHHRKTCQTMTTQQQQRVRATGSSSMAGLLTLRLVTRRRSAGHQTLALLVVSGHGFCLCSCSWSQHCWMPVEAAALSHPTPKGLAHRWACVALDRCSSWHQRTVVSGWPVRLWPVRLAAGAAPASSSWSEGKVEVLLG
jgi:hypothetical protein